MSNKYRGQVDAGVVGEGYILTFTWGDLATISAAVGKEYFGELLTMCEAVSAGFAGLDQAALTVLKVGLRKPDGKKLTEGEWQDIDVPHNEVVDLLSEALCQSVHGMSKDAFLAEMDKRATEEKAKVEAAKAAGQAVKPDPTEAVNATS